MKLKQADQPRKYLDNIMTRPGPFTDEEWIPGQETIDSLEESKVLSVGICFDARQGTTNVLQSDVCYNSLSQLILPSSDCLQWSRRTRM